MKKEFLHIIRNIPRVREDGEKNMEFIKFLYEALKDWSYKSK